MKHVIGLNPLLIISWGI